MKLLFATSLLPEQEATSGYEIANRAILFGLRALGHDVVPIGFASLGNDGSVAPHAVSLGELSVSNADADTRQKLIWLKRAMQNQTTFAGAKLQVIEAAKLETLLKDHGPFDAVVLNGAPMAAAFEKVFTNRPFVFVAHNVEWKTAAENAQSANSFFERILFGREAKMLKALENRLAHKARHVFTFAKEDEAAFLQMGSNSVSTVPLIVGLKAEQTMVRDPKWDAGLIGTWTWAPNRVGLDWFLNEVTPHLPADFSVAIAGKMPDRPNVRHKGVEFLGRVPSALDFVRDCACLPLVSRAGSGVQLKTLEAFELGLPTIATGSSTRGIPNLPSNCVIENDPEEFAGSMVRLAKLGKAADLDGRLFHASQKEAMLSALNEGICGLQAKTQLKVAG